jgi:hypothetical protein
MKYVKAQMESSDELVWRNLRMVEATYLRLKESRVFE